jgi:hypothetical protein
LTEGRGPRRDVVQQVHRALALRFVHLLEQVERVASQIDENSTNRKTFGNQAVEVLLSRRGSLAVVLTPDVITTAVKTTSNGSVSPGSKPRI